MAWAHVRYTSLSLNYRVREPAREPEREPEGDNMGTLFQPDELGQTVTPRDATGAWALDELQGHVGGYIERVPVAPGLPEAYCNEEGQLRGMAPNMAATLCLGVPLVGAVVVLADGERLP